jgi:hypothetical protein
MPPEAGAARTPDGMAAMPLAPEPPPGVPAPAGVPVAVVLDPADSAACHRLVASRHDLAAGRVVCHPTPGASATGLALDLLVALGKRFDQLEAERVQPHARAWELACLWLAGEQARHLLVLRAHRLDQDSWRRLLALPGACQLTLWLVVHRPDLRPAQQAALAQTPHQRITHQQFAALWEPTLTGHPRAHPAAPDASSPFPAVPGDDFATFRAAARSLLDPQSFHRVDAVWRAALAQTLAWPPLAHTSRPAAAPLTEPLAVADVAAFLQRLTVASSSAAETLVRLRAAQAGFFRHGYHLRLTIRPGALLEATGLRAGLDRPAADRLRWLATPRLAAAGVLALATELTPEQLGRLTLDQVDPDSGGVRVAGQSYAIPAYARGLVRTLWLQRHRQGATRTSPLFAVQPTGPRLGPAAMQHLLATAAAAAALRLPTSTGEHLGDGSAWAWLDRRGLAIQPLPLPDGPPQFEVEAADAGR